MFAAVGVLEADAGGFHQIDEMDTEGSERVLRHATLSLGHHQLGVFHRLVELGGVDEGGSQCA